MYERRSATNCKRSETRCSRPTQRILKTFTSPGKSKPSMMKLPTAPSMWNKKGAPRNAPLPPPPSSSPLPSKSEKAASRPQSTACLRCSRLPEQYAMADESQRLRSDYEAGVPPDTAKPRHELVPRRMRVSRRIEKFFCAKGAAGIRKSARSKQKRRGDGLGG